MQYTANVLIHALNPAEITPTLSIIVHCHVWKVVLVTKVSIKMMINVFHMITVVAFTVIMIATMYRLVVFFIPLILVKTLA